MFTVVIFSLLAALLVMVIANALGLFDNVVSDAIDKMEKIDEIKEVIGQQNQLEENVKLAGIRIKLLNSPMILPVNQIS